MKAHIQSRFGKVLENEIFQNLSVFDTKHWPSKDVLKESYVDEMKALFRSFKHFYDENETEAALLEQWHVLKMEIISSSGLMNLGFHELWARMLVKFSDEYPLVLRLVVIMLLIPMDTSECERIFSLLNDMKTSERNSLGQVNLRNLMKWYICSSYLLVLVIAFCNRST